MNTYTITQNKFLKIELYLKGILLGVVFDNSDRSIFIIVPFFSFEFRLPRKRLPNEL
jgi:hypothetical protein